MRNLLAEADATELRRGALVLVARIRLSPMNRLLQERVCWLRMRVQLEVHVKQPLHSPSVMRSLQATAALLGQNFLHFHLPD